MKEMRITEKQFEELFELYYEELCRIVFPILKDRDAAQDVVQDVFVKMWLRREELLITTSYKAYLYKSVVFRALDFLRKKKNDLALKEELKIGYRHFQDADTTLEQKELRDAIALGMERMPEQMRIIFHLSRFSSLKNREIAEQLKISIKTVESNLSKALKFLSEHLAHFSKNPTFKTICWFLTGYLLNR